MSAEYERLLGVLKNPAALADNADALEAELTRLHTEVEALHAGLKSALDGTAGLMDTTARMWRARDAATVEADALRAENARLKEAIVGAKRAWDALGRCADEFLPEYPGTCIEYQDALDAALVTLWQVTCQHERAENGFCAACRVRMS